MTSPDRPPNILFFLPDQQRFDWTGLNPALPLRTPNLRRLAEEGTRFIHAVSPSPLCAPARACLASGRRYDRCGVPGNHHNYPLEQPTYYQALRRAGYRVAGVGKFDLHKDTSDPENLNWGLDGTRLLEAWGFSDGIDNEGKIDGSTSYRIRGEPRGPYLKFLADRGLADIYVDEHRHMRDNMGAYTTALPDEAYCDNWLSENGRTILRDLPHDAPWHLAVNFTGPHSPMDVTESMRERWKNVDFPPPRNNDHPDREGLLRSRQNYAAMVENIDRQIGLFMDVVRERGEWDRTLIVYSSDHGEMLGDHQRWGKGSWRHPSVAIPLIVSGPGVQQGARRTEPVSLHDLTATFLTMAGVAPLPEMDSQDLSAALQGDAEPVREVVTSGLHDWRLAYDGRQKLVLQRERPPLLFDLDEDPAETLDRAAERPHAVRILTRAIEADAGADWREKNRSNGRRYGP